MIKIRFLTETPNSEMNPIAAEMPKASPEMASAMMPPPTANGMPERPQQP
jgi:hypothetical protein